MLMSKSSVISIYFVGHDAFLVKMKFVIQMTFDTLMWGHMGRSAWFLKL